MGARRHKRQLNITAAVMATFVTIEPRISNALSLNNCNVRSPVVGGAHQQQPHEYKISRYTRLVFVSLLMLKLQERMFWKHSALYGYLSVRLNRKKKQRDLNVKLSAHNNPKGLIALYMRRFYAELLVLKTVVNYREYRSAVSEKDEVGTSYISTYHRWR